MLSYLIVIGTFVVVRCRCIVIESRKIGSWQSKYLVFVCVSRHELAIYSFNDNEEERGTTVHSLPLLLVSAAHF